MKTMNNASPSRPSVPHQNLYNRKNGFSLLYWSVFLFLTSVATLGLLMLGFSR